jgi:cytochrome bd ubiquinol oxidase subunit I
VGAFLRSANGCVRNASLVVLDLSANSWMQTPVGYELVEGRFFPKDWFQIVFNPSFPYRLAHTIIAFYVTTAFVVAAVAAYLIRRGRFVDEGRVMLSMTLWLLSVLVPLQIFVGDLHGLNTLEHQPAKLAAIEAHWQTASRVPLTLFAVPDESDETNRYAVEIPILGSLVLTHDPNGIVRGLKDWPRGDRPPVAIPFFAFRIMVGIGLIMLALVAASWWLRFKGRLFETPWFLRACELVAPLGFAAVLAGWTTTEVGRQPWTVSVAAGSLRTGRSGLPLSTGPSSAAESTGPLRTIRAMSRRPAGKMMRYATMYPAREIRTSMPVSDGETESAVRSRPRRHESPRPRYRADLDAYSRIWRVFLRSARRV